MHRQQESVLAGVGGPGSWGGRVFHLASSRVYLLSTVSQINFISLFQVTFVLLLPGLNQHGIILKYIGMAKREINKLLKQKEKKNEWCGFSGARLPACLPWEQLSSAVWMLTLTVALCFPHSALVDRDSHRPGFVLCPVPAVAGCIPIITCFIEFLFLTTSFKILKWWPLLFCTVNCDFG